MLVMPGPFRSIGARSPPDGLFKTLRNDFKMDRKSFKIDENHKGTEPVAEAAAALAALSIIFANIESAFAKDLLMHAEELYEELVWPMVSHKP